MARARAWMEADLDEADRAEIAELVERAAVDTSAEAELASRFEGLLAFGTAGLRGRVEAGESRMNRATVVRATAGLADHLLATLENAAERGVVLGRDARRGSEAFQADAAAVLAAKGLKVWLLPEPGPTPVVPFSVRRLGAAAGVMVTASHNPPADNGYKVYWSHGAQIAPPLDVEIAAAIAAQPAAREIERAADSERIVERSDLRRAYLDCLDRIRLVPDAPVGALSVVYTAMHGVGGATAVEAFSRRGLSVTVVDAQQAPDPAFPTVDFPNPEEPNALDLAKQTADEAGAELILANDPDADRLGVALRGPDGAWEVLSGNDIGVLLARHLIDHDEPGDPSRLVVNTVVSSRLLGRMAKDLGVRYAESLTGFKYIAERMRTMEDEHGLRALMGYEEALGFAVCREVHDKDGISAALLIVEMAAIAKAEGRTLLELRDAIHRAHGLFVGWGRSVVLPGADGAARIDSAMERLRALSDERLRELGIASVWDMKAGLRHEIGSAPTPDGSMSANLVLFELAAGGRVAVRPSGTEPKLKFYLEREARWPAELSRAEAEVGARTELEQLERQLLVAAGLD